MNSHFFTCSSGLSSTLGMAMVEECEGLYFKELLPTQVTRYQDLDGGPTCTQSTSNILMGRSDVLFSCMEVQHVA